jgi:NAD(P)-dependent dehydrogenase (short-subunit alcohol dehydrogenase family)
VNYDVTGAVDLEAGVGRNRRECRRLESSFADCARHCVRINAVLPGVIARPMTDVALHDPALAAARAGGHPIGRFGQANEVAELVAWLLSDASSFSTGSAFFFDGGANGV